MGVMQILRRSLLLLACSTLSAQSPLVIGKGTGDLSHARVFPATQGNLRTMANGGKSRDVLHRVLATGEAVSIHESVQPAGTTPNPPHTIQHSEFIVVQEGTLAFEHDGLVEEAGPGSVLYVAYGTLHTVRNIGTGPAKYMVIAIGGDSPK